MSQLWLIDKERINRRNTEPGEGGGVITKPNVI